MKFELTLKLHVESPYARVRVAEQLAALFKFGTIKDSIGDGLGLWDGPQLVSIRVQRKSRRGNRRTDLSS